MATTNRLQEVNEDRIEYELVFSEIPDIDTQSPVLQVDSSLPSQQGSSGFQYYLTYLLDMELSL